MTDQERIEDVERIAGLIQMRIIKALSEGKGKEEVEKTGGKNS
jgi:hypothetical protein